MADLCTTSDVSARVPKLATHPALGALVTSASQAVENHCRRTFAQATVDEFVSGNGWSRVWLKQPPIVSLTSVAIGGQAVDVTDFSFNPDTGELVWGVGYLDYRHGPIFPRGRRNIEVVYVGGYASVPGPVVEATVEIVKTLADAAKASPIYSSERIGDYAYTQTINPELPMIARILLAPYVLDPIF